MLISQRWEVNFFSWVFYNFQPQGLSLESKIMTEVPEISPPGNVGPEPKGPEVGQGFGGVKPEKDAISQQGGKGLDRRKQEQDKKDRGLIERIRDRLKFLTGAKKEAWRAMGETDQLAIVTKKLEGSLRPDQTGFTVEIFTGSPRTQASQGAAEKVVVMADNMEQAKGISATLGKEQQVIVASPHALPFREGALDRIVDPHKLTHVGPKDEESLGSPWRALRNLYTEVRALMKEKRGDIGFLAARPEYVSEETHEAWRSKFGESLKERAAALSRDGKLIFSVGVRPEDWKPEAGYMAHVAQVGEVFLSPAEIKQLTTEAGLKIDAAYAGMGPRTQGLHVENAIKAVIMSTTGWGFERFADEVLLPAAHSAINLVGARTRGLLEGLTPDEIRERMRLEKVDLDRFEEARTSGLASARTPEGKPQPPDRVIIVASKEMGSESP